jgi:glycosyltransferase involved in cell wall biosynthesis
MALYNKERFKVVFFHRKPRTVGNYSVEFIFNDIRERLKDKIEPIVVFSKYESSGLFKRLYNCIEAWYKQATVNHITGDVNYLGLLLNRKNTIHTILDCVHLETSSGLKYKILKLFWLVIPEKRSRFITAISTSTKNEILKHHACDPEKIVVIPVAISDKFVRKDQDFNAVRPRILQIGTAPNKNIPRLIEALSTIPCVLEIIGKHNPDYEAMLKKYNIEYEYNWGVSDADMIVKYEKADIITLASTYEGFGMPILEAQAIGRPVVTSDAFSMPEVAGNAAALVDPLDIASIRSAFEKIISDAAYRNGLVAAGFENVKRFNPDKIANMYFDLYKTIYSKN